MKYVNSNLEKDKTNVNFTTILKDFTQLKESLKISKLCNRKIFNNDVDS